MAKKFVKLSFIKNKPLRKVTHKKRKANMIQKLNEMKTSYGVKAHVIVYISPKRVERSLNDDEENLKKKIEEAKEQLKKQREEIRVKEMIIRLHEFIKVGDIPEDLGLDELKEMDYVIGLKLKEIEKLIEAKMVETSQNKATDLMMEII